MSGCFFMMSPFEILAQGEILLQVQYEEDRDEAYAEEARREYEREIAQHEFAEHSVGGLTWWTFCP